MKMFGLPNKGFAAFSLTDDSVELWPGCVDMVAIKGEADTLETLFATMKAWLENPVNQQEGRDVDNEMAVLRTTSQGKELLVAFDLGGSDNCTFAFIEIAQAAGIQEQDFLSKSHGHPNDLVLFCS